MIKITESSKIPCIFIRYNPDTFKVDGEEVDPKCDRKTYIINAINYAINHTPDFAYMLGVIYLFYSGVTGPLYMRTEKYIKLQ